MTPQRLVRGEAMAHQVTADATTRQVTGALVATPALPYALTAVTAVGRVAPALHPLAHLVATTQAPHALAVVATTAPAIAVGRVALDHPLAALGLHPPHHGAAARLVAPLLLAAVLEAADSRHF